MGDFWLRYVFIIVGMMSLVTKCNNIISQKICPCVNGGIKSDKIDTYGGF